MIHTAKLQFKSVIPVILKQFLVLLLLHSVVQKYSYILFWCSCAWEHFGVVGLCICGEPKVLTFWKQIRETGSHWREASRCNTRSTYFNRWWILSVSPNYNITDVWIYPLLQTPSLMWKKIHVSWSMGQMWYHVNLILRPESLVYLPVPAPAFYY